MRRVVVTGYGILNALGKNKEEVEENLFKGRSGVSGKTFSSVDGDHAGTVGEIKDLPEVDPFFAENGVPYDRCAQLALMAARECVAHAEISFEGEDPYRRGIAIGTSLGGMLSGQTFHRQWLSEGLEKADQNYLYLYPLHAMADVLAKKFGFQGVKNTISTACAASGNIIGYGADMIKDNSHDLMLVGGVDPLCVFSFAGFKSLKALDEEPCKPYSASHGINLGEGGAFLLLEEYEHAAARGAHMYAEILGYGLSADAYHPTAPDLGGGGASRAMQEAIRQAGISKEDVSYVNGHGTGTTANDKAERSAFKTVFGELMSEVPLSSIKGAIGHCLGAAGAQECVVSIMALNNGLLPPTVNFESSVESPINLVPNTAQKQDCEVILSNSFAFGGNNVCLALGKVHEKREPLPWSKEEIVITGMGCCGVGGSNLSELWDTFEKRRVHIGKAQVEGAPDCSCGVMPQIDWKKYIPGKYIRRIDEVTKLAMTAGKQALDHSRLTVTRNNCERIGVIYATGTGPLGTIVTIDKNIAEKGIGSISLSDFPNSVINAAPGNFCIANMLKGATSTLSAGTASFLVAFQYAADLLHANMVDAVVMVSADECNDPLLIGNDKVHLLSHKQFAPFSELADGMVLSPGSVAVVLERKESALSRKASIYAAVKGYAATSDNGPLGLAAPDGEALHECIKKSLQRSKLEQVDLYIPSAMGIPACDAADEAAIRKLEAEGVLGADSRCSMVTPLLGVASGSNSGYELLGALYSFMQGEVIGLPDDQAQVKAPAAGYCAPENTRQRVNTACISSIGLGGVFASLVLERYQEE